MYDFANSSYTTVVITVSYAVVFPRIVVGDGPEFRQGNFLWGMTLAASYLLTVALLPFLGAWMDQAGHRKWFLLASTLVTVLGTASLGLTGPGTVALAMVLVVISNVGFSIGESFVASFLPDLGEPHELGRISGMAWGFGYLGGLGQPDPGNELARWAGPITAAWFALAATPTFLLLKDRSEPRAGGPIVREAFGQLLRTARHLGRYRDLMVFFVSYFFAMTGLSIVVAFAFIYGDQVIHWSASAQAGMFVATQVTATLGALGFGQLQSRLGDKPTYALTLLLWVGAVALIWATPAVAEALRSATGADWSDEKVFLLVGGCAGLCIGATQSAGRTLVALLSPTAQVGEFFGLWGVFGKLAGALGMVSVGFLQLQLGLQNAILVTGLFFGLGFLAVLGVDMERGRAAAR